MNTAPAPAERAHPTWREALRAYRHPRVLGMLFLGFSAGLPLLLVGGTLSLLLADVGITRTAIGFFSWIMLAYSLNFVWAPVVDRLRLPLLTRLLGRRRSWMLVAQLAIMGGLIGLALYGPLGYLPLIAGFAALVAFGSATQDIAIDAYRIEAAPTRVQGAMAAAYTFGYRMAMMMAGAGALYLSHVSWGFAYVAMALCMLVGVVTVLLIREPEVPTPRPLRDWRDWGRYAVLGPFRDFFSRFGVLALVILLFVAVFRLSDIVMGVMAMVFYYDLGFDRNEIATVSKVWGLWMTIAGALIGGLAVLRFGVMRTLLVGAVLVALTNLVFAYMAIQERDMALLILAVSADNLAAGYAVTAFIAYLSSLTSPAYTATQYALFTALMNLPGRFVGGFSGAAVDAYGYAVFFTGAAALGIPAILLALFLMNRTRPLAAEPAPSARAVT
ncbi:MFS transporter [Ectothiorhodospiraceae bacterium 2226]|nr:MFS transporter [Ectothiorhodospiraceae bacterium 2226]